MAYHAAAITGLNFTWLCKQVSPLDINKSDEAGCYYRAGDEEYVGRELRVNNSLMTENTSYFITVQVTKDERQAEYTQEVFIVAGDPPEVQIRYEKIPSPVIYHRIYPLSYHKTFKITATISQSKSLFTFVGRIRLKHT